MLAALLAGCGNSTSSAASDDTAETSAEAASEAEEPEEAEDVSSDGTYTKISDKVQSEIQEGEYSSRTDADYANLYNTLMESTADAQAQMPGVESTYNADGQEISVKGVVYDYPLEGDNLSVSIWAAITGNHQGIINSYDDYADYAYASECTNIDINWTSASELAAEEQLNLLLASGDMTDLICGLGMFYTGNVTTLYDEELIYDITDYVAEYCPNYSAWLNSNDQYQKLYKDDEGHSYGWYDIYVDSTPEGWFIRSDKLAEWGIDAPVTVADYEDCFARMMSDGSRAAIQANSGTFYTILASSFDIATLDGPALYVDNGTVASSWYSDNAKLYVETMHDWYEKGYIYSDILAITTDRNDSLDHSLTYDGDYFMFSDQASHYADFFGYDLPEGWDVQGGTTPVLNAGDVTHFDNVAQQAQYIVLTTSCDDIETTCKFMDWFYTDEGINTCNYGPEGESWYWTDDGERVFTDAIWNNTEYDLVPSTAYGLYQAVGRFVSVYEVWSNCLFAGNTVPIETMAIWDTDGDSAMTLPTDYLFLTTEENDTANQYWTDLSTYAVETISKMIMGQMDIDSEWDNLVDTLQSMGLDEIVAQYEAAYQRYLDR